MQYSLRHLLILTAVVAAALAAGIWAHRNVVIPRTPIRWQVCTPAELVRMRHSTNRVVIAAGNATLTGSISDCVSRVESPRFRRLVARDSAECWHCDLSNGSYAMIEDLEQGLQIDLVPTGEWDSCEPYTDGPDWIREGFPDWVSWAQSHAKLDFYDRCGELPDSRLEEFWDAVEKTLVEAERAILPAGSSEYDRFGIFCDKWQQISESVWPGTRGIDASMAVLPAETQTEG